MSIIDKYPRLSKALIKYPKIKNYFEIELDKLRQKNPKKVDLFIEKFYKFCFLAGKCKQLEIYEGLSYSTFFQYKSINSTLQLEAAEEQRIINIFKNINEGEPNFQILQGIPREFNSVIPQTIIDFFLEVNNFDFQAFRAFLFHPERKFTIRDIIRFLFMFRIIPKETKAVEIDTNFGDHATSKLWLDYNIFGDILHLPSPFPQYYKIEQSIRWEKYFYTERKTIDHTEFRERTFPYLEGIIGYILSGFTNLNDLHLFDVEKIIKGGLLSNFYLEDKVSVSENKIFLITSETISTISTDKHILRFAASIATYDLLEKIFERLFQEVIGSEFKVFYDLNNEIARILIQQVFIINLLQDLGVDLNHIPEEIRPIIEGKEKWEGKGIISELGEAIEEQEDGKYYIADKKLLKAKLEDSEKKIHDKLKDILDKEISFKLMEPFYDEIIKEHGQDSEISENALDPQKISIFCSHATVDKDIFRVLDIKKQFEKYKFKQVVTWEEDASSDLNVFMQNARNFHIILLFCSPNSKTSGPVQGEWDQIPEGEERNKIIPIFFLDKNDIPPKLMSLRRIRFNQHDFEQTIYEIYTLIKKKVKNKEIKVN